MGLFVCNRLILPARPHKLNKRGNWVLIKSQEWGCVKDTTTPDRHGGKVCLVSIPCEQPPGSGSPSLEPLMSVWRGNLFPFTGLLLEGQWEESKQMTLSFCQPTHPHFASVHIWLGNRGGWPLPQPVEKLRNSFPGTGEPCRKIFRLSGQADSDSRLTWHIIIATGPYTAWWQCFALIVKIKEVSVVQPFAKERLVEDVPWTAVSTTIITSYIK